MLEKSISPELSFLLSASLASEFSQPAGVLNWDKLYRLAEWHRIRPLLSKGLKDHSIVAPEDWANRMKRFRLDQTMYSLLLFEKTIKIYNHLSSAGISVFPMKGTIWASLYYGDPGMREFGDIDFFLKKEQLTPAVTAMRELDFVPDSYRKFLLTTERSVKAYRDTDYQLPLAPVQDPEGELVELQWNVSYPRFAYTFHYDDIMKDSVEYRLMGSIIHLPRPEHQLILMIIHHGGIEQWDKLKYVADLLFFLKKHSENLDWPYVERLSREKGVFILLSTGLSLLRTINSDVLIPEVFQRKLNFLDEIYVHWEKGREAPLTKSIQILKYNLKFRDRQSDRLNILAGHVSYLSNLRLLWSKVKWYFFQKS